MQNQSIYPGPLDPMNLPHLPLYYFNLQFTPEEFKYANRENQKLKTQNSMLQQKLKKLKELYNRLQAKGNCSKPKLQEEYVSERRKYRKRRTNLAKNFWCPVQGCTKRFSSDMALRNHQRNQHKIKKRQLNKEMLQ